MEAVSADPALLSRIQNTGMEDVLAIAKEHGFNLTEEDFKATEENSEKLDAAELEAVSGGKICVCVIGGGGEATRKDQRICVCVGAGFGYIDVAGEPMSCIRCECIAGGGRDKDGDEAWADVHNHKKSEDQIKSAAIGSHAGSLLYCRNHDRAAGLSAVVSFICTD